MASLNDAIVEKGSVDMWTISERLVLISLMFLLFASNSLGVGRALLAIYERPAPWPPAGSPNNHVISTNNSWYDAYNITVTGAKVGDVFRLRGHITFTNTSADRVFGECRLTVNNEVVGTRGRISVTYKQPPVANTLENESRDHAPVYCDGLYEVILPGDFDGDGDVDGRDFLVWQRNPAVGNLSDWQANEGKTADTTTYVLTFKLQSAAVNPGGMTPTVLVENGHGHLVVEHYRVYDSIAATAAANARVLTEYYYQFTPQVVNYPSSPPVGQEYDTMKTWPDTNFAYQMDIPVAAGDRLRFLGMATCYPIYTKQVHDGPVLGIWLKDPTYVTHTLYSPWIAEGFSPAYTINPMWNDAITGLIPASGTNRYWLGVHGTLVRPQGVGGEVAMPLGYFYALKYRQQTSGGLSGGRYLTKPFEMTTAATSMPADGTWVPLISQVIAVDSEEIVKLSGAALFEHPGLVSDKVTTNMVLRIRNSLGEILAQTPISYKLMSKFTKYNSIRSDLVTVLNAGDYFFELLANCPFSGSPIVSIDPNGTKLYYESFALPEGVEESFALPGEGESQVQLQKKRLRRQTPKKRAPKAKSRRPTQSQ